MHTSPARRPETNTLASRSSASADVRLRPLMLTLAVASKRPGAPKPPGRRKTRPARAARWTSRPPTWTARPASSPRAGTTLRPTTPTKWVWASRAMRARGRASRPKSGRSGGSELPSELRSHEVVRSVRLMGAATGPVGGRRTVCSEAAAQHHRAAAFFRPRPSESCRNPIQPACRPPKGRARWPRVVRTMTGTEGRTRRSKIVRTTPPGPGFPPTPARHDLDQNH